MRSLGLDLNNVIIDTARGLHKLSCEIAGLIIPPAGFTGKGSIGKKFPIANGQGQREFLEGYYEEAKSRFFSNRSDFLANAHPVDGAVEAIQRLHADGWILTVITDAKSLTETLLSEWCRRHRLPHCERIFTRGVESKVGYGGCCDAVIDNDLSKILPFLDELGDQAPRLLHFLPLPGSVGADAPRETSSDPRIITVQGWEAAVEALQGARAKAA
jgi:hypothetical protein